MKDFKKMTREEFLFQMRKDFREHGLGENQVKVVLNSIDEIKLF